VGGKTGARRPIPLGRWRWLALAGVFAVLACTIVLGADEPSTPTGNVVLDHLLAPEIVWGGALDYYAMEDAIRATATKHAPWYVVPANHKWYRNWAISRILIETLDGMAPRYPQPRLDVHRLLKRLEAE